MAYGKRKAPAGFGVARKKGRFSKKFGRSAPARAGKPTNNSLDTCFVKCTRLATIKASEVSTNAASTKNGMIFGRQTSTELAQNARFLRFASMYQYFRVHKMKVTFGTTGLVTNAVSSFDPDSDTQYADIQQITAHLNCRFHQCNDVKKNSRTQNLQVYSKWQDFYSTQGAGPALSGEKLKSTINYAFTGLEDVKSTGLVGGTVTEEWIVEFRGLRDKIDTQHLNNTALAGQTVAQGANVGPAAPIPTGMMP